MGRWLSEVSKVAQLLHAGSDQPICMESRRSKKVKKRNPAEVENMHKTVGAKHSVPHHANTILDLKLH